MFITLRRAIEPGAALGLALLIASPPAWADDTSRDRLGTSAHQRAGKERVVRTTMEQHHAITLDAPDQSHLCAAQIELDYQQRDTLANVNAYIATPDCREAAGEYRLRLTYRDANDQVQTLEIDEQWSLHDPRDETAGKQYAIGDNALLLRVAADKVTCTCVTPATTEKKR